MLNSCIFIFGRFFFCSKKLMYLIMIDNVSCGKQMSPEKKVLDLPISRRYSSTP